MTLLKTAAGYLRTYDIIVLEITKDADIDLHHFDDAIDILLEKELVLSKMVPEVEYIKEPGTSEGLVVPINL